MRPSSRSAVLDAAVTIAQREGVGAVTFDSVSQEAARSRGGIMYHFPTKEALLNGMREHVAAKWEAQLLEALGTPFDESTARDRLNAYVKVAVAPATRFDLALLVDPSMNHDPDSPWQRVIDRWIPVDPGRHDGLDLLIARMAADGLWMHGVLSTTALSRDTREALAERIIAKLSPEG